MYGEGGVSINCKGEGYVNGWKVIVKEGNNDGIMNMNELREKVKELVWEIEWLKGEYNCDRECGIEWGGGVSGGVISGVRKGFCSFNKRDYEDCKFVD